MPIAVPVQAVAGVSRSDNRLRAFLGQANHELRFLFWKNYYGSKRPVDAVISAVAAVAWRLVALAASECEVCTYRLSMFKGFCLQ